MKKIFTLLFCIAFFSFAKAQSFEIGGRYLAISNWFFNSNVTNSGGTENNVTENYSAVYSYTFGLHLAYNFNEHTGLETNVLYASLSQSYNGNFPSNSGGYLPDNGMQYYANESFKSTTTVNAIQVPVFFRFLSGNGAYVELGPEVDIVTDAGYSATYKGGPGTSFSNDVASSFANNFICGVLSFGNNIRISHAFFFNINLRFSYDFTDLKGVDPLGQNMKNPALYSSNTFFSGSYSATNAVSAAFGVGFLYRFGHDF
jgi:hypothetical protein